MRVSEAAPVRDVVEDSLLEFAGFSHAWSVVTGLGKEDLSEVPYSLCCIKCMCRTESVTVDSMLTLVSRPKLCLSGFSTVESLFPLPFPPILYSLDRSHYIQPTFKDSRNGEFCSPLSFLSCQGSGGAPARK